MTIASIAAALSDDVLVANLNAKTAELDEWAGLGTDVLSPEFARLRALVAALRAEWRKRSGEII